MANAHPTAWLNLSPCPMIRNDLRESDLAEDPFKAQRRFEPTYRFFAGDEPMAHPPPCRPIAAYVGEAAFKVAVRSTKRDLFDSLIEDKALGVFVDHLQTVAADMQD